MKHILDDQLTISPRKGLVAFCLSLLTPGLGQVYNGQPKKGAIIFALLMLIPILFIKTRGATYFYGMFTLVVFEVLLRIFAILDSVITASHKKDYVLKPYNTWYFHLLLGIGMYASLFYLDVSSRLGVKSFTTSTPGNYPTIQAGDHIVADMQAYKHKSPDYGDIAVYQGQDGQFFVFRIVGKPNDYIEIKDNILRINGKPAKTTFIKETTIDNIPVIEMEEELINGHKHSIYKYQQPPVAMFSNVKMALSSNSYYLLGDNRDNAADSRYFGPISKDRIKGRVLYSYWGKGGIKRMNIDFTSK